MKRLLLITFCALPMIVSAAEPVQLADNNVPQKRFMSLDSVRNGTSQIRSQPKGALRSDRQQMNNGFMLIDRKAAQPVAPQHALLVPTKDAETADAPKVIRGNPAPAPVMDSEGPQGANADPVLSLFNSDDSETLASFHDVLRAGRAPVRAGGSARHAWPLPLTAEQKLVSPYGMRADPFDGHPEFHGGIDISAPTGTAVLASADGTVMQSEQDSRYGKFITIMHADGSESRYGHLSAQVVKAGDNVRRGQVIGAVGATGRATGSHLDYRLSQNGTKVDPMRVLNQPMAVGRVAAATDTVAPKRLPTPGMMKVVSVR